MAIVRSNEEGQHARATTIETSRRHHVFSACWILSSWKQNDPLQVATCLNCKCLKRSYSQMLNYNVSIKFQDVTKKTLNTEVSFDRAAKICDHSPHVIISFPKNYRSLKRRAHDGKERKQLSMSSRSKIASNIRWHRHLLHHCLKSSDQSSNWQICNLLSMVQFLRHAASSVSPLRVVDL